MDVGVGAEEFPVNANQCAQSHSGELYASFQRQLCEKDTEITFLQSTNQGLLQEVNDLEAYVVYLHTSHTDLMKEHKFLQSSYAKLQATSDKDSEELASRLSLMQHHIRSTH